MIKWTYLIRIPLRCPCLDITPQEFIDEFFGDFIQGYLGSPQLITPANLQQVLATLDEYLDDPEQYKQQIRTALTQKGYTELAKLV